MPQPNLRANPNRGRQPRELTRSVRWRFWLACLLMGCWALAICVRLFWLQVAEHDKYDKLARQEHGIQLELAPRRGLIYDRNLRELAMTVKADSFSADPALMDTSSLQGVLHLLAGIVHTAPEDLYTSEEQITARFKSSLDSINARNKAQQYAGKSGPADPNAAKKETAHGMVWIARRVAPEVADQVKALNLKGIFPQREFKRSYPDNQTAAQVLGYVSDDDKGLSGVEQKFDQRLFGKPGQQTLYIDARGKVLGSEEKQPEAGENLMITIDENIQFMAEKALDAAMARTQAANGTVVIQDVHTGQILALAIRPTFNPNDFRHTTPALLRNHAVSDVYEPGSTFKLVTYSAAIDQHIVSPDDIIDCQGGSIQLPGRVIHDDKSDHYGKITIHEALEHSSDVAAVKLALRLGPEKFNEYIRGFGFGARSGLELPGETRGLLASARHWTISTLGSVSIGQEVAVTPIQLVSMVSTIANGGVYLPPHIVMPPPQARPGEAAPELVAQPFKAGEELPNPLPTGAHRVISTMSAAQMRKMMEGVVLFGTGKAAQLNGYSSGGKTGTAQKIDPATHTYSKTMHVASFAGIAPVNNPVIAIAVVIDNPHGDYYGSSTSAPVFAQVAQLTLEYLGVPHDIEVHPPRAAKPTGPKEVEPIQEHSGDAQALLAAVKELPEDDPLRQSVESSRAAAPGSHPAPGSQPSPANPPAPSAETVPDVATVTVPTGKRVKVPSLIGMPLRQVVEQMAQIGLNPQVVGRGLVRSQQPAAGTEVSPGSKVIVHCSR